MDYIELNCVVKPLEEGRDILTAELGDAGFESFVDTEDGIVAYIQADQFDAEAQANLYLNCSFLPVNVSFEKKIIPHTNWNETWEQNFQPVLIDDKCHIRATFHEPMPDVEYEIVIDPKMAFGTGHHETTSQMASFILEENMEGKSVIDMGCGTAILAILAGKKGANPITAIDNDPQCAINSAENTAINDLEKIVIETGDASILKGRKADIMLANINRNILLADIHVYSACLSEGGILFMSGFYTEDLDMITKESEKHNLFFQSKKVKNNWVAAKYIKK